MVRKRKLQSACRIVCRRQDYKARLRLPVGVEALGRLFGASVISQVVYGFPLSLCFGYRKRQVKINLSIRWLVKFGISLKKGSVGLFLIFHSLKKVGYPFKKRRPAFLIFIGGFTFVVFKTYKMNDMKRKTRSGLWGGLLLVLSSLVLVTPVGKSQLLDYSGRIFKQK